MSGFWKDKTVLITGHTGFKGSWLSLWLNQLGAKVIGYGLDAPTKPSLFMQADIASCIQPIFGDIRDLAFFKKTLQHYQPNIIFHLAAQSLVRHSYNDPFSNYTTNVIGTLTVLEAVRTIPNIAVCQIITSDKCYENNELGQSFRETDRLGGKDPYSNSKACAELMVRSYRDSFFNDHYSTSI
jgi:CDP-glucose 4,6-dehydratase